MIKNLGSAMQALQRDAKQVTARISKYATPADTAAFRTDTVCVQRPGHLRRYRPHLLYMESSVLARLLGLAAGLALFHLGLLQHPLVDPRPHARLQERALRQLQADLSNIDRGMASARSDSSVPPATLRRLEKSFTALQTLIAKLGQRIGVATRSSQPVVAAPAQQAQATQQQQEVVIELQGWGQADQAILEERSVAATQIVRETQELKEAFDDLAVLVQEQSEALDQMETNTGATVTAVQAGNAHLEEAHEMQKGTRKRMCIILILAVVVLGVIVGSVVVTSVQ